MIALDADHPALVARTGDQLLDSWIFAAATSPVSAVWVAGRQVVAEGRHVARDRITSRFRSVLRRLLTS